MRRKKEVGGGGIGLGLGESREELHPQTSDPHLHPLNTESTSVFRTKFSHFSQLPLSSFIGSNFKVHTIIPLLQLLHKKFLICFKDFICFQMFQLIGIGALSPIQERLGFGREPAGLRPRAHTHRLTGSREGPQVVPKATSTSIRPFLF